MRRLITSKPVLGGAWARHVLRNFGRPRQQDGSTYGAAVVDVFGKWSGINWGTGEVITPNRRAIPLAELFKAGRAL